MLKGELKSVVIATVSAFEAKGLNCFLFEHSFGYIEPNHIFIGDYQVREVKSCTLRGSLKHKIPKQYGLENEETRKDPRENVAQYVRVSAINDERKSEIAVEPTVVMVIATSHDKVIYFGKEVEKISLLKYGVKPVLDEWEQLPDPSAKPEAVVSVPSAPERPASAQSVLQTEAVKKSKPHPIPVAAGQLALF